jgi:undecaprenyl-diphosphatase
MASRNIHVKQSIHRFDRWLATHDEDWSTQLSVAEEPGFLRTAAIVVTRSGDALPLLALLAAIFLLGGPNVRTRVLIFVLGDLFAFLATHLLKFAARRPRPEGDWGEFYRRTDPHSFPSGHSARGGVYTMTAVLLGPWWLAAGAALWGVAVAYSRVAMGVHYLSDAVVGFCTGMGMALLISILILT